LLEVSSKSSSELMLLENPSPFGLNGMHIPNQRPPVDVKGALSKLVSFSSPKGITPSQRPIPPAIAISLRELGKEISDFNGNFQCAAGIYGVLDQYEKCLVSPGATEKGCALSAARFIAGPLCDTYCSLLCKIVSN
jgi:hypothetical protein